MLLLLGGRVEAEVKLPAPLGVAGQGCHHPLAGGARRLEQPYCRHTSGQLLAEVTQRRSIHLSSGSTETRQVTPGAASAWARPQAPAPPSKAGPPPCPSPCHGGGEGAEPWAVAQEAWVRVCRWSKCFLPCLSLSPSSSKHRLCPGPERGSERTAAGEMGLVPPPWSCQSRWLQVLLGARNVTGS